MKTTFAVLVAAAAAMPLAAQAGITDHKITLGQSCAMKGPAAALGQGMNTGLAVAFSEINANGGIHGRKIELSALNDSYEPKRCEIATKKLIKDGVFLLVGEVGTPTSKVAVPVADAAQVPFLAPFTGAEFLRHDDNVVNVRGSYFQEMETLAQYLVDQHHMKKVACFYQDDGYGKAGLTGIQQALQRRSMKLCGTGTYKRNTMAVKHGLDQVAATGPDAVVMVGAYKPCAEFIKQARKVSALNDTTFCNISFVGTKALVAALGGDDKNCIVSQVVPFPWDTSIPLVKRYHDVMKKHGKESEIGFISLEGYMAGVFFGQVMDKIDGTPTREQFLATVPKVGNFDLGGIVLRYGPGDNQGMDQVFLTRLNGGQVEPLPMAPGAASPGK